MSPLQAAESSPAVFERTTATKLMFSLVLATVGRTAELANFLLHLDAQSYKDFELIVVDQNLDDRLEPVLEPYRDRFTIKHLRSAKGLSRARNVGLQHISGDVVAFPDDDCWYQPTTLEQVAALLRQHADWDGITGGCNAPQYHFLDRTNGMVNKINVWRRSTSCTIFLRAARATEIGKFDELLGVGAESGLGSGEEVDYLLRALTNKSLIYYRPDFLIEHPDSCPIFDAKARKRGYAYGRGLGYTLRKHHYSFWYLGYFLMRAIGGGLLSVANGNIPKARYHAATARGRLSGWLR